jgi:hypothetical protein
MLSLTSQFSASNRGWSPATLWGLSILTAVRFFVCIVLHCATVDGTTPGALMPQRYWSQRSNDSFLDAGDSRIKYCPGSIQTFCRNSSSVLTPA